MIKNQRFLLAMSVGLTVFSAFTTHAQTTVRQRLHGHIPEAVSHLQPIGRFPGTNRLNLAIGLPLRNEEALDNLLQQIYDPASPNFRQYLMPEQFTEMFGPTEQDYQAVIDFAKTNGLTVTGMSANRVLLDVSGSVADIEKAFQVTMRTYRHPKENRMFYAPDAEPSVDVAVPILHVSGLDNFELPHPKLKIEPAAQTAGMAPNAGSGPGNTYMGNDFRAAYVPGVSLSGAGQTVGLLQFDGYYSSDIAAYESLAGLPSVTLVNVPVDGGVSTPGSGNGEVCLDIEMVISMAPGISKIIVYEAPNPSPWPDLLNRMANDNLAKQISCSWGGGSADPTSEQIFKQMASQGQSFFNASGDSDAFTGSITFPSDSTNITQVGGTTLTTTGPNGSYVSETVWNWGLDQGSYVGSSGGISTYYPIPSWQRGINMTTNRGSTTMRNVPDVALTADNVYVRYGNGSSGTFGGTSCAAPLWAGFTALVNQQAVASGRSTVGFVNPAIYTIGQGANYAVDFHDITTGNNTWPSSPANFYAVPGYDLCTGWGTPAGQSLINALAGPSDTLVITPASGFAASGPVGGPFSVTTQNFSLTNLGTISLNWSVNSTASWLTASPNSGALAAGGQTTVTANLNSAAYNLAVGTYSANVWFTNQTTSAAQLRQFTLLVGQSLVQNGGFEAGTFTSWTQSGNPAYTSVTSGNSQFVHSGTYGAALGPSGSLGYLSQTLPTFAGQNYLLSLWVDSPKISGTATPNEFSVSWNGHIIFDQSNMGKIGWTNLLFIVTATGPSTVLQLGFRDDPYYLGLDDINVAPIPVLAFRAATKTSSTFNLTWGTMTGLVYQVQYKTNLLQTNWINLGKPLIATDGNLTVSDTNAIGSSPQRFYRLMESP
jgi:subtilase family serine protease